jgi:hypothetical protein
MGDSGASLAAMLAVIRGTVEEIKSGNSMVSSQTQFAQHPPPPFGGPTARTWGTPEVVCIHINQGGIPRVLNSACCLPPPPMPRRPSLP